MNNHAVKKINLTTLVTDNAENAPFNANTQALLGALPITVEVRVGQCQITLDALSKLKHGEVLNLNESLDAPVDIIVNQQVIARGELVNAEGYFGVMITETAS